MVRAVKRLVAFVALLLAAYAGFRWGGAVFPPMERWLGISAHTDSVAVAAPATDAPSAEIADATLNRFERLRRGSGEDHLALSGTQLTSIVRFSLPGIVPPGVSAPTVGIDEGRVRLSARVALEAFPRLPHLDQLLGILPDTVPLEMEGALVPFDPQYMALLVDKVSASHVPIPKRMVADVLRGLGRQAPARLPPDALPVPIPRGVKSVYVQRDSLVLVAARR
ncbi:MAG: hypothetical protein LJF04_12340 [Gemmatimonadetes bacterium]|nr:hypothetical protein [Gemmatimonadota bacterium]